MKLLAFDTGTEAMSVAVCRSDAGDLRLWQHQAAGGANASTALIPNILDLLRQAELDLRSLDAVCFGSGPGSFTGLRTACAVAQGLAFGAGVPVLPVNSLLALAEDARLNHLAHAPALQVTALLDARMDEIYTATFAYRDQRWQTLQDAMLLRPDALAPPAPSDGVQAVLAGNVFANYGARLAQATANWPAPQDVLRLDAAPTALAMLRLAPQLLAEGAAVAAHQALPTYIRDKVAQTSAERAADKAAQASTKAATGASTGVNTA
jgi:tRNA threonylcarbamoyladenosine biosynthesis protein TsaB